MFYYKKGFMNRKNPPPAKCLITPQSFYFVRHGQTDYNIQRLFTGHHDIPLNATGVQQAHKAASYLKNRGIQVITSSPLQRAFQTAHIIAQELQVPIVVIDDLKEGNWGALQGTSIDNAQDIFELWQAGNAIHDAEMYNNFKERVIRAINQSLTLTGPVLIVAHGGVFEEIQQALKINALPHSAKNAAPCLFQAGKSPVHDWTLHPIIDTIYKDSKENTLKHITI